MRKILVSANDFVEVLEQEFETRVAKNKKYSMRAFARDLELSPSRISDLLNRRRGMNDSTALKISENLGFTRQESELFVQLARCAPTKNVRLRAAANKRKNTLIELAQVKHVSTEDFSDVAEWFHFAILEMTHLPILQPLTAKKIATYLAIPESEASEALKRLMKRKFLEERDGNLVSTELHREVGSRIPSQAVRHFHKQIMSKMIHAIDNRPIGDRFAGTSILAFKTENKDDAIRAIDDFRIEFGTRFGPKEGESSDELYAISVQFFKLSTGETK
ncbi:MAG: TIGR02147 family protein [Bdellovibrionota bacterium]